MIVRRQKGVISGLIVKPPKRVTFIRLLSSSHVKATMGLRHPSRDDSSGQLSLVWGQDGQRKDEELSAEFTLDHPRERRRLDLK